MQPYDWCDPNCPNPCTCQDAIELNAKAKAENNLDISMDLLMEIWKTHPYTGDE